MFFSCLQHLFTLLFLITILHQTTPTVYSEIMEGGKVQVTSAKEGAFEVEENDRVEDLGHLVNQEEHEVNWWKCVKQNPRIVMWSFYSIWFIILASFDNAAGISTISIPEFRKDFGTPYDGNYVLPAKWQSAYNGAPTALYVQTIWRHSRSATTLLTPSSTVASSLGSGLIADRFGRKWTFFLAFIISFTGITIEMIATTNPVFFAGKSINGIAIGLIISVGMTYVGEVRGAISAEKTLSIDLYRLFHQYFEA